MKTLFTAFATIVLALGLPCAAFANANVELSVGGEDTPGNKLDIVATGVIISELQGTIKLTCKGTGPMGEDEDFFLTIDDPGTVLTGDTIELVTTTADFAGVGGFMTVIIDAGAAPPTMKLEPPDATFPCTYGSGGTKETDVSLKIK